MKVLIKYKIMIALINTVKLMIYHFPFPNKRWYNTSLSTW